MKSLLILYQLLRADFLERIRRNNFLLVLGVAVILGYLFVPAADASYTVLNLSGYRGVYNSAWVALMVAIVSSTFLTLPGFYLVKNSITRDMETRVGQIIATTPISKPLYMFGKFLSNFSVLALMVAVMAVTSIAMQFMRGESYQLDLWHILAPFIIITLPSMALIAAMALLFESVSWLRAGFGNLVWFFVWLAVNLMGMAVDGSDPLGISRILSVLTRDTALLLGRDSVGITIVSFVQHQDTGTFVWHGFYWGSLWLDRLLWIFVAIAVVIIASLLFHRFDPSRQKWQRAKSIFETDPEPIIVETPAIKPEVSELVLPAFKFSFPRMVLMEMRMLIKGVRWWWVMVAAGLWIASLSVSVQGAPTLLAFIWLWPVLMWSSLGSRETTNGAEQLVFSSPRLLVRQLPALWLSGFSLAILTGSGVLLRMAISGNWPIFFGFVVGALFIPSLALALGVWTRSSKMFEILFVAFFWYIGLIQKVPLFDFIRLYGDGFSHTFAYLLASVVLCCLAVLGRYRQLHKN